MLSGLHTIAPGTNIGPSARKEASMDLRKLKKLIDLVQESGIAELEITEGEEKVKIVKGGAAALAAAPVAAPLAPLQAHPAASAPASAPSAEPAAQEGHVVKAPMVGTF